MRRLIASGCSFTEYEWPTWVAMLSPQFDETYNYGKSGAGNEYIFHSIVEADTDLKLTKDDLVIIMWSGYYRFDYFQQGNTPKQWQTLGDWFNHVPRPVCDQYLDTQGWATKSINYMLATERYLAAKGIPFKYSSIYNLTGDSDIVGDLADKATAIKTKENFYYYAGVNQFIKDTRGKLRPGEDGHPTMYEHLQIAETLMNVSTPDLLLYEQLKQVQQKYLTLTREQKAAVVFNCKESMTLKHLTAEMGKTVPPMVAYYSPLYLRRFIMEVERC